MAILLTCACGKQFRAKEEFAGKTMKCRNCGLMLVIPEAAAGSGGSSNDALGEAGVTTSSNIGKTPMPSERVASRPGILKPPAAEAGVVSSSRLARKAPPAPDPLANSAKVPVRRRLRQPIRHSLWPWIGAGIALLILFGIAGGVLIWWTHTYDVDVGDPLYKGRTDKISAQEYDMLAGGIDIWDESDQFHYYTKRVVGDFDVVVRVEALGKDEQPNPWAKAGLMARASLDKSAPHVSVFATPGMGFRVQRRVVAGEKSANFPTDEKEVVPVSYPYGFVRLQRVGDDFIGYSSPDGRTWKELLKAKMKDFPRVAYVGLAATSHDRTRSIRAKFRDYNFR
jgi:hypothetical protein